MENLHSSLSQTLHEHVFLSVIKYYFSPIRTTSHSELLEKLSKYFQLKEVGSII